MGDLYRTKVEQLATSLESVDEIERERAKEAVRGSIEKIVIAVDESQPLMVVGISEKCSQQPPTGKSAQRWRLLPMLVAGACNTLYRLLCWTAA
jgi:hypothetical protein